MSDRDAAARLLEALRNAPPTGEAPHTIHINFNAPIIVTPEVAAALVRIIMRQRMPEPQKS